MDDSALEKLHCHSAGGAKKYVQTYIVKSKGIKP